MFLVRNGLVEQEEKKCNTKLQKKMICHGYGEFKYR